MLHACYMFSPCYQKPIQINAMKRKLINGNTHELTKIFKTVANEKPKENVLLFCLILKTIVHFGQTGD